MKSRQRTDELEKKEIESKKEEERQYIRDLISLSRTAIELVDLSPEEDIYQFIAEKLKELIGDCVISVNSFDEASNNFCVRAVEGIGKHMDKVLKILGKHPVGLITPINDEARNGLTSRKLKKVSGGLYELSIRAIPKATCNAIEKLLNLGDTYAIGFSWKGRLFSSAAILMRKGAGLGDSSIIETFVRQASIALQRRQAEEALRKANEELEIRVKKRTEELAKSNKELQIEITERKKAEERLRASLEEKEVMLREIYNRVKNNMQIVSSLLRLQSESIEDKKLLEMFKVAHDRIKSMALVHEGLYRSRDLARIDFSDYVKRLTTHLFSVYNQVSKNINLKLEVEEIYFDINKAIPCGLIINELVTNSLKYAFPEGESGEICVKIDKNLDKYDVIVKDTGKGFPEDEDFLMTETLGMQLVTDLVKQLNGTIHLDRKDGTKFKINF
jgi:two-component sensor histidine kinase